MKGDPAQLQLVFYATPKNAILFSTQSINKTEHLLGLAKISKEFLTGWGFGSKISHNGSNAYQLGNVTR
jgi:hypothetical protein